MSSFFVRFCLLLIFTLAASQLIGQFNDNVKPLPGKYKKLYKSAQADSRNGNYHKALPKLNKIIKACPDYIEPYIKKAGVEYKLLDTTEAIQTLSKAILKFGQTEPEIYFTRGYMHFEKGNYSSAKTDFEIFLRWAKLDEERNSRTRFLYDVSCFRDSLITHPVSFKPMLLPNTINSPLSEYSPSLSIDSKYLVFTRRVNQQEDLLVTYRDSLGGYSIPFPLLEINTAANEGAHCISADGSLILFTGCDRDVLHRGCDLYYSVNVGDSWTKPANVGKTINTPAWESQPCLSADGRTLFFVSDRVGGSGGRDIWYSKKNKKNIWSEPENLGPQINTPKDDETPFLHPDGRTLYWRSNGRLGMGDFDIYTAKWNPTTQGWENIRNLGYPINTENSEGGLIVSLDGTQAFFSTDLFSANTGGKKNLDLCSFTLPAFAKATPTTFLKLYVYDKKTNQKLSAEVEIQNLINGTPFYAGKTNSAGILMTPVHGNSLYAIHVTKDGYSFASRKIDVSNKDVLFEPFILEIGLEPLEVKTNSSIVLHNLFFKSGSFDILPDSYAEIENLFQFMIKNPNIKIQITGHTDNVGGASENQILSEKRALSVKLALESKGISPERIYYKGKGQEEPIDTNDTPEGRQNNRRTECIIINN